MGVNYLNGYFILSSKKSVLDRLFMTYDEIEPGEFVAVSLFIFIFTIKSKKKKINKGQNC